MSDWLDAVQFVVQRLDRAVGAESPFSLEGADAVEGCIARALVGELDPTGQLALGRYPPFPVTGAGAWLAGKGKYDAGDPASREALAGAVRLTLAVGWVLASEGGEVVPGRAERDVFSMWAPDFTQAASQSEEAIRRKLGHFGSEVFVGRLKEARLAGRLGAGDLRRIGFVIAGGGFLLRVMQSSLMDDAAFTQAAERGARAIAEDNMGRGRWAWDNFGV